MPLMFNQVMLIGKVSANGIALVPTTTGGVIALFDVLYQEVWSDKTRHTTAIPCMVLGPHAGDAVRVHPGTDVLVQGSIMRRNTGEVVIRCWDVHCIKDLVASNVAHVETIPPHDDAPEDIWL